MNENTMDLPRRCRVVPSNRAVRGVRAGDPVVVPPVEDVLAEVQLLALPTVRRVARDGLRGVVLVPIEESTGAFPASAFGGLVATE